MNRIFVRKWIISILMVSVFISNSIVAHELTTNFQDALSDARESFTNVYYELVKKGQFNYLYNNNLIINTDFDSEFPRNGAILLALTEWLEQNQDDDYQFLLKKLNKFFGLQFHRFICKIDVPKAELGEVSHAYHTLYSHKIENADSGAEIHPFRTTLTKAMIFILMVEFGEKAYQQKKEDVFYFLEGVRRKLIKINNGLPQEVKVPERFFEEFINHVQTYGLREPIMKPVNLKLIVFFVALGLAITALVGYVVFYVIPNDESLWDGFKKLLGQFGEGLGENLTRGAITEIGKQNVSGQATGLVRLAVAEGNAAIVPHLQAAQEHTQQLMNQVIGQVNQLRLDMNQNLNTLVQNVDQRVNQLPLNLIQPIHLQQPQGGVNNDQQPVNNQQPQGPVNNNPAVSPIEVMTNQAGRAFVNGLGQGAWDTFVTRPWQSVFGSGQQAAQPQNVVNNIVPHNPPAHDAGDGN